MIGSEAGEVEEAVLGPGYAMNLVEAGFSFCRAKNSVHEARNDDRN